MKKKKGGGEPPAPGLRKPGQRKAAGPRDSAPVLRDKGWHPGGAIKRRKAPVPVGAVWWVRGEGHPCLQHFGAELRHQRSDLRGWSLEDLHQACGLCKSFLCDLENGVCTVTQDAIFLLEAGMTMADGGLMRLVRRRWRNSTVMAWLAGWFPESWACASCAALLLH